MVTIFGLQEVTEEQEEGNGPTRPVRGHRGRNVTVTMAILPTNGLVFYSAVIGGMNAQRFQN